MRSSRLVASLAVILMLGFMLPMMCFALVAADATAGDATMAGGCHGQYNPMPMPSHSCCYASHQVPQTVQMVPSPVPQNYVAELIDVPNARNSYTAAAISIAPLDTSPPTADVLRI